MTVPFSTTPSAIWEGLVHETDTFEKKGTFNFSAA